MEINIHDHWRCFQKPFLWSTHDSIFKFVLWWTEYGVRFSITTYFDATNYNFLFSSMFGMHFLWTLCAEAVVTAIVDHDSNSDC